MQRCTAYMRLLNANLKALVDISKRHQADLVLERTSETPFATQNRYQEGDLVLFQLATHEPLPTKLTPKFLGPYAVISHTKNDVTCKHVILGHVKTFHVTRLKLFHGTLEEAKNIALHDNDQYVIERFITYRGDPMTRTTIEFEIIFADGSVVWLPWSRELFDTEAYETFCRSRAELAPLIHDAEDAKKLVAQTNKTPIIEVQPGDTVYVDLRSYGATWYASRTLPDLFHKRYLLEYTYTKWADKRHLRIWCECPLFGEEWRVDHDFVRRYGANLTAPDPEDAHSVLVDEAVLQAHPDIKEA
jgi:hypothetical protein